MKQIPRIRFAHLPTPVEPMENLSKLLQRSSFLVKRDDQTGLAFGGNKTRKLEFLIAEAKAQGAKTLITAGAIQSNHCRQTAAAAARFGFECILVLMGDPMEKVSGNLLLDHLLGAEIIWSSHEQLDSDLKKAYDSASKEGRKPFLIPFGGSNPIGVLGYVYGMKELIEQGHRPTWIVFPTASGGTQAGLVLGAKLFGYRGRILGISIIEKRELLAEQIRKLIEATADSLEVKIKLEEDDILINDDYLGGGYGVVGEPELEAIQKLARTEGLFIDPVYTGRAAAGMIDLTRKGIFTHDDSVLFWHTGGTPSIFADKYTHLMLKIFD